MTWHNLPCSPTLHAIAAACPDGWVECVVSNHNDDGAWAHDPRRVWGLDEDALDQLADTMEADRHAEVLVDVPHGAIVIGRHCETTFDVNFGWGVDGKPVYTTAAMPDYTGEQAAPKPGHGDMWAQLIERAEGLHALGDAYAPSDLIERMKARRQLGLERYGTPLQAGNGREVLRDVLEEALDLLVYLEQLRTERPTSEQFAGESQMVLLRVVAACHEGLK